MTTPSSKKRVLSGIRATGRLHLGNYLGAVKGMLELQDKSEYETFYMVADAHAITTPYDTKTLAQNRKEVILDYLSAGLDPAKSVIFVQSMVPAHFELSHYLGSVISVNRMLHLPTYKEKVKQYSDESSMALLNYPVLMAADILAYKAEAVPVGVDQEPHLEIARQIARNMNTKFGTDFPEPKIFETVGKYIPSLLGDGKMSKSVDGSFINLTDDPDTIALRLAKVPTDSGRGESVPIKGSVANLLFFVELFQGSEDRKKYEDMYLSSGIRYSELKMDLAKAIFSVVEPIQKKRIEMVKILDDVINDGAKRAGNVASQTLLEVKQKMGF
ncbi:tryptophan--tRNA ligase [candidate division WWE3 bacterium]|nr:tryptophan--tRNA ligase [candidate division WWE3 bacterium]